MCKKKQFKYCPSEIDMCMKNLIDFIVSTKSFKPIACCCGHNKYPMTIIITNGKINWDLMSNKIIPRKRNFYKKDKKGYYYIPEVCKEKK